MTSNRISQPFDDRGQWDDATDWEASPLGEGLDIWALVFRRKSFIVLGIVVGIGLGLLYYAQAKPVYESTAQMLIKEKSLPALPIEGIAGQAQYGSALADHSAVITSRSIIERTLRENELHKLPPFAENEDRVENIKENLIVEPLEDGTSVLNLAFRTSSPEDCETVLNSLMVTYQDFLGEIQRNVGKETTDLITDAKDELLKQLQAKESEYDQFRQNSPLMWKNGEATNLHQERQVQVEEVRSQLLLTNTRLEAQVRAIEAAVRRGNNREALLLMASQSADGSAWTVDSTALAESRLDPNLLALLLEEQQLAQRFGPDYPKLKSVRMRIEVARQYRDQVFGSPAKDRTRNAQPIDLVATYLQSLREQLNTGREEQRNLDALFQKEEKEARALAAYQVQEESLRSDIQRTQQLFDVVVKRLEEINLIEDYGAYIIQVIESAELGEKVSPSLLRVIPASCILGLLAGFALAYVVDRTDKTFHSPAEIGQELRLPLVGHIPQMSISGAINSGLPKLAPILCTAHHPRSPQAEAYRAVRTALYFNTRGKEHRVIQITSPMPTDGKSTLVANLAITIANSGKKVLLLDADFRRPTQHKLFGLEMGVGLSSVVDGTADPPQAVQGSGIDNLFLMTCGPRPHNPSELLSSPRLKELLDTLREQFDFVLLDTPPVLAVTDPSAVAARVDGVLLTLRIAKNVRPNALRAQSILDDLGANILGVVVNGVGAKTGYGYGGGYHYSYGYGGQYGQTYGETSNGKELADYYQTDDTDGDQNVPTTPNRITHG